MDIDNAHSYASEQNLIAGLKKIGLDQLKYLIVCNRQGRFTAIFPLAWNQVQPIMIAQRGFMVVG